jgi:DNA-binding GntR family transcriptional regulator
MQPAFEVSTAMSSVSRKSQTPAPPSRSAGALGEWVYRILLDEIVFQELPPGTSLQETDLAERLAVSRTPVREALRRLATEGFVNAVPYKGFSVTAIDITDLNAVVEVRLAVEPYAARRAAEVATDREREQAGALLDELWPIPMDPRPRLEANPELLLLDRRIHTSVYHCTHNRFLTDTLVQYHNLSVRIMSLVMERIIGLEGAVAQHQTLLEGVRDGNGAVAEATMREHVLEFDQLVRTALQSR